MDDESQASKHSFQTEWRPELHAPVDDTADQPVGEVNVCCRRSGDPQPARHQEHVYERRQPETLHPENHSYTVPKNFG